MKQQPDVSTSYKSVVNNKGELDLTDIPDSYLQAFSGIFDQTVVNQYQQSTVDKIKKLPDIRRGAGIKPMPERVRSVVHTDYSSKVTSTPKISNSARGLENSASKAVKSIDMLVESDGYELNQARTEQKQRMFGIGRNASQTVDYSQSMRISPTNFEINLMHHSQATGDVKSIFDFSHRNMGDIRTFKNEKLERCKKDIEETHARLRQKKNLREELLQLKSPEQHIQKHLRPKFFNLPGHGSIAHELKTLNTAFVPILHLLVCYKSELGLAMQRMIESYNILMLLQFEGFYEEEHGLKREYNTKIKQLDDRLKEINALREQLAHESFSMKELIASKEKQSKTQQEQISFLERKLAELRADLQAQKEPYNQNLENRAMTARQRILEQIRQADDDTSSIGSDSSDPALAQLRVQTFESTVQQYQSVKVARAQNLKNLSKIVGRLMDKGNTQVGTQTDPISFYDKTHASLENSFDSDPNDDEVLVQPPHSKQRFGKTGQSAGISTNTKQTRPPPNSIEPFTKADALLGNFDERTLMELHMRLNGLFNKIKKQNKMEKKETKEKDLADMGKNVWSTPTFILIYLHNTINLKAGIPVYSQTTPQDQSSGNPVSAQGKPVEMLPAEEDIYCKIKPWVEFKTLLYDIYDHRIKHAWEINGAVNTSYLTLEEHLVLFFIEEYKDNNRQFVEEKLLEFLATLKYYTDYWKRARTFAIMYGFLKGEESFFGQRGSRTSDMRFPNRLNEGRFGELEIPMFDIYTQEFFMHAYCIITAQRAHFLESSEGYTYMPFRYQDAVSKRLLMPFISDQKYLKWTAKIKQFIKKTKLKDTDEGDTEYLDIDVLLSEFIEEFRSAKAAFEKELNKQFTRELERRGGKTDLNLSNYINIFSNCKKQRPTGKSSLCYYPGPLSMARALLYSQMCGRNLKEVNDIEFIAGCNRFALDNPTPTITSRVAFFGNEESIEQKLRVFAEKLQIDVELFDPAAYGGLQPGGKDDRDESGKQIKRRHKLIDKDMLETQLPEEQIKKVSGVTDIKLLNEPSNLEKFASPPEAIVARNITVKIKDIVPRHASIISEEKKFKLTNLQVSMTGNKQIVVPSFSTTGALFARHFDVLKNLKRRLLLLQIAYQQQQDEKRTWDQVQEIIKVLNEGLRFLAFDEGAETDPTKQTGQFYVDEKLDHDEKHLQLLKQQAAAQDFDNDARAKLKMKLDKAKSTFVPKGSSQTQSKKTLHSLQSEDEKKDNNE